MAKWNMTMTVNHPLGTEDYKIKDDYVHAALQVAKTLHPSFTLIVLVLVPTVTPVQD